MDARLEAGTDRYMGSIRGRSESLGVCLSMRANRVRQQRVDLLALHLR